MSNPQDEHGLRFLDPNEIFVSITHFERTLQLLSNLIQMQLFNNTFSSSEPDTPINFNEDRKLNEPERTSDQARHRLEGFSPGDSGGREGGPISIFANEGGRYSNPEARSKLFLCDQIDCGKAYKSKENLTLHVQNKHLGRKPYKCEFCDSKFSHRNGKTYHERKIHYNYLPHACCYEGCDISFASKSALTYHMNSKH